MNLPLPWQQSQWDYLLTRKRAGTLPHALLLTGVAGLGKQLFAKAFAKNLLCLSTVDVACEECRNCRLLENVTHPDFYLLQPAEEGKAIRIEQIRELIEGLNKTAIFGLFKIAIISHADKMNTSSANALLKTLEEPPSGTILLLISNSPGLIPATIRSRCQQVAFLPPSEKEAYQWLSNHLTINSDLKQALHLTDNAPLAAMAFTSEKLEQWQNFLQGFIALTKHEITPVQLAASWSKFPLNELIIWLQHIVMNVIREKMLSSTRSFSDGQLFFYLDKIYKLRQHLIIGNLNQQLQLENLFCIWQKMDLKEINLCS